MKVPDQPEPYFDDACCMVIVFGGFALLGVVTLYALQRGIDYGALLLG